MKYVKFNKTNIVQEIIPDFVSVFPNVPIAERYSKEFLSECLEVADEVEVEQGWEYDPLNNIFKVACKQPGETAPQITEGEKQ